MGNLAVNPVLFADLDRVIEGYARSPDALIQVLHRAQELFGYLRDAEGIIRELENALGVKMGETTRDNTFTLETARCLGSCGLAPAVMMDSDVHGRLSPSKVRQMLSRYH